MGLLEIMLDIIAINVQCVIDNLQLLNHFYREFFTRLIIQLYYP